MTDDRKSLPPCDDSLARVADDHRKSNDELERSVGHIVLPPPRTLAVVDLSDEQRDAVLHEIFAECRSSGGSTVIALERYQDKVRARLAKAPRAAE